MVEKVKKEGKQGNREEKKRAFGEFCKLWALSTLYRMIIPSLDREEDLRCSQHLDIQSERLNRHVNS